MDCAACFTLGGWCDNLIRSWRSPPPPPQVALEGKAQGKQQKQDFTTRQALYAWSSCKRLTVKAQPSRDALVKQLWNKLTVGGVLVLIEPGTPTGFRFMHHTRELFITRIASSARPFKIG
eukprot:6038623-Amphidinium_carterae.3